jgi:hypothetical protein
VIAAYIQGIEDEKCSAVSLAALRGFTAVIPVLPASRVNHTTDLISLKVQILRYRHLAAKKLGYEAKRKDFVIDKQN